MLCKSTQILTDRVYSTIILAVNDELSACEESG